MAERSKKFSLLGPLQALIWATLGALAAAFVNHYFLEKREVVESRLAAYKEFAQGQAKLNTARSKERKEEKKAKEENREINPDVIDPPFAEANEMINSAKYQILYLGSRETVAKLATYYEAAFVDEDCPDNTGKPTPNDSRFMFDNKPDNKPDKQRIGKLDVAIYGSMRNDLKQAATRTVCPYYTAIVLFNCRLREPFCANGDEDCDKACAGVRSPSSKSPTGNGRPAGPK